jgi:plastocyanin
LRVIWVALIVAVCPGGVAIGDPSAAANAPLIVSITEQGFSPAVVVVPTGTVVQWHNNGTLPHSLSGQVRSPGELQPGETYLRRFAAPGQYSYLDGRHPDSSGTVVVTAGSSRPSSSRPSRANGNATYRYSANLKLSVSDQWTYYDGEWDSTTGPCKRLGARDHPAGPKSARANGLSTLTSASRTSPTCAIRASV